MEKSLKLVIPIYLTADIEDLYKIAPADLATNKENYLIKTLFRLDINKILLMLHPSEVDFSYYSTIQVVSVAASLIPFFEHDDANRALMVQICNVSLCL
jgi:DNA-directed RNA polymerase subunit beta